MRSSCRATRTRSPAAGRARRGRRVERQPLPGRRGDRLRAGSPSGSASPDEVHVGAGSVSILAQLILAAAGPGRRGRLRVALVRGVPGAGHGRRRDERAGAARRRRRATHDLPAMAAAITDRTRVIMVCSPNNPTSTIVTGRGVRRVHGEGPRHVLVLLDEAYREFVTDPDAVDGIPLLDAVPEPRRAAHLLEGVRARRPARRLRHRPRVHPGRGARDRRSRSRSPSPRSGPRSPRSTTSRNCSSASRVLVERRTAVEQGLAEHGWTGELAIPAAQGNFVWLPTGEQTVAAAETLERHGIVARVFAPDGIRVAIGEEESVEKLLRGGRRGCRDPPRDARKRRVRVVRMSYTEATVQLLSPEGTLVETDVTAEYLPWIAKLDDARLQDFYRQMVVIRRFDIEAGNLQRQGQLALWMPSLGQEAAQVGSGCAAKAQDHIFPSYREHVVGRIRGVDPMDIIEMLRGLTHGGWVPAENGNFHLYTLVLGSQTLHATGLRDGPRVRRRDRNRRPRHRRGGDRLLRRRRLEPGRRQRGAGLRRELPDPAGVLPAEQPLGDLGAGRTPVAHAAVSARDRLRHPERADRRQRRARELRGRRRRASTRRAAAGARASSRR